MVAAGYGKAGVVRMLLSKEGGMHNTTDGETAMMIAADNGHLECVTILAPLEKGMKDKDGSTAKYYASRNNNKACYDYLSSYE